MRMGQDHRNRRPQLLSISRIFRNPRPAVNCRATHEMSVKTDCPSHKTSSLRAGGSPLSGDISCVAGKFIFRRLGRSAAPLLIVLLFTLAAFLPAHIAL